MKNKILITALLAGITAIPTIAAPSAHTGFSIGANLGVTSVDGQLKRIIITPASDSSNLGARSPVVGLFLGYGWAPNPAGLYLGGEVFGQYENVNAKRNDNIIFPPAIGIGALDTTTRLRTSNTFGAVGKIGYVCKDALFFVKLGVASTKFKLDFINNAAVPATTVSANSRKIGFIAGVGMDYAVARNWTVGGEYIFTSYRSIKLQPLPQVPSSSVTYKPSAGTFNLRLKYTF